jgi:hypothetical protein
MSAPLRIPKDVNLACAVLCMLLVCYATGKGRAELAVFAAVFMIANVLFYVFGREENDPHA